MTLNKVEKGLPGVSMGAHATVLFVLGMADRVGALTDARSDTLGLELDEERLPQRIRSPRDTNPRLPKMGREILVYVGLDGTLPQVGRLWTRASSASKNVPDGARFQD